MALENVKIAYGLWFSGNAAGAIDYYKSVFSNVGITHQANYSEVGSEKHNQEPGSLMFANFTLEDAVFQAINGGDEFKKNPSISFFINCENAEEAKSYWEKLSKDGKVLMALDKYDWSPQYGWIEDPYGVSWQIYTVQDGHKVEQKINPSLMFVNKAFGRSEEAYNFYMSAFKNSEAQGILKYPAGMEAEGKVMHSQFKLNGQTFMAMDSGVNGEHKFNFNGGISFILNCTTQEEIDYFWEKLGEGGQEWECGWLEDKFGVAWQIVPVQLDEMMTSDDAEAVKRVTAEMMQEVKLDLEKLTIAFGGN